MIDVVPTSEFDANPRHARDRLLLVSNDAMRARRRPWMLAFTWLWHAVAGLAIGWPIASFVREAWGHGPRGDAPVFEPGGLALLDVAMRPDGHGGIGAHVTVIALVCAVLGLLPLGALLTSVSHATLDRTSPPMRAAFERAAESFGSMLRMLVLVGLVQGAILILGGVLAGVASANVASRLDDAAADIVTVFVFSLFLLLAAFVGVVHDVARCAAIRFRAGALPSLRAGWRAVRTSPLGVTWSWAWRALAGLAAAIIVGVVATRIGGHGDGRLVALAALHQLVIGTQVALRASWLARAMRLVDRFTLS